jgi:ATP/maltotriose-dependent transcriptional regulator MalT/two-component SAPR family response regulator
MTETTKTRKKDPQPLEVPYPSKVALPARRPAIVRRQRLIDLLTGSLERRVTLVGAPAGYGKSTLLLDAAQTWEVPVCWYSLDERDRDEDLLLRYFLASGQRQFPGFGADLARALYEEGTPAPDRIVDLMVTAAQSVDQRFVMVLDDFHFLDEAPEDLNQILNSWLPRLPGNCHLVLSGRTRPDLVTLPLMSARQEVATVRGGDFAFSCEEVVQLYREALGKEIPLDEAQHLADVTEGWAAALILMADRVEEARTVTALEQLRGSDTLYQYIKLEQYDPLPDDAKDLLTGCAALRTFDEKALNKLLGVQDAEERLNYLERRSLFVSGSDGAEDGYRLNNLFRGFLVSHLRAQDPGRFRELNLTAADLREQAENWEEAVYHCVQAGEWDRIVRITERVGWRLFEEGKWDTLADWLEAVPAEEMAAQPKLILWKARILHYLNQIDRALALLAQAIVSLEANGDSGSLAEALVTKGMCLRVKGDYQESKEALAKARSLLLKNDGRTSLLTEARKELGITYSMCGELAHAEQELKGVLEIYEAQGDMYNIAHASDQLACALALAGRIAEGTGYMEEARQRWTKLGNDQRLIQTLINLGMLYYLQGDFEQAEAVFRQGVEKARSGTNERPEVYLLASLADIKRDTGEYTSALELYGSSLEQAWGLDDAYIRIYVMDAIANTYRLMGNIGDGESWSRRAQAEAVKRGGPLELGLCSVTEGLLLRQKGLLKEAVDVLETALEQFKEADAKREVGKAYFHLAEVYFSLKRKRLALECLDVTAKAVRQLGYDHFLVVEAGRAPLLVQYAAAHKLADGYFGQLLKVIKTPSQSQSADVESEVEDGTTTVLAYGLGNLRVEIDGREITDLEWRSEKSKEMFFFFLCNRRPLRKEEIVAAIWPDLAEEKTNSAFHSTMYRLRKALYTDCIAKDSGHYILDPRGRFVFDVETFQKAVQQAESLLSPGGPEAMKLLEKALDAYEGPFAPEFFSEWVETIRWQTEEQFMRLLTTLAGKYSEAGEYKRSAEICQRILDVDEYNEAAWYRLLSNYIQSGQVEAAKYSYNRYAQIVSESLGEEEMPEFEEMEKEITQGEKSR